MYLSLCYDVSADFRVDTPSHWERLAHWLSAMWARLLVSLHIVLHVQTAICSTASTVNSHSTVSVVASSKPLSTTVVASHSGLPSSPLAASAPTAKALSTNSNAASASQATSAAASSSSASVNATSTTSSSATQPSQTLDPATLQEFETITTRRLSSIIGATASPDDIPAWCASANTIYILFSYVHRLASLGPDGKWPDSEVDYTTGCAARRANWPAQTHWARICEYMNARSSRNYLQIPIVVMAAAWHGGLAGGESFVKDPTLHSATSLAMDYWYGRDLTNIACLDSGGTPACPCSNPDNTLWYVAYDGTPHSPHTDILI